MRIQIVSNTAAGLIFSICILLASPPSYAETAWTTKNKNFIIQTCFNQAQSQARAVYNTLLYGKIPQAEYEAFMVSNNTQLLQSCQCVVNRLSSEYQPDELLGNPEGVTRYTNTLSGSNGPCGLDVESLLSDMRTRISGSH